MAETAAVYSNTFGSFKSKVRVLAGLLSFEASVLGLSVAVFSRSPHMAFVCKSLVPLSSLQGHELIRFGPTLRTSFGLYCLFKKGPVSRYSHTVRIFWGDTVQSVTTTLMNKSNVVKMSVSSQFQ